MYINYGLLVKIFISNSFCILLFAANFRVSHKVLCDEGMCALYTGVPWPSPLVGCTLVI